MCLKTVENCLGLTERLEISDRKQYLHRLNENFKEKACRAPKPPPDSKLIQNMRMTPSAYRDIKNYIGARPAESGGILLSQSRDFTITGFIPDIAAATNSTVYQPNTEFLNSFLKGRNHEFVGIAHSHSGMYRLSGQDQRAAWSNMTSPGNPHLNAYLMPLIQTIPDTGRFEIFPYIVTCHPRGKGEVIVKQVELKIIG